MHKERCRNELGYSCDVCGKAYNTKSAMTKHFKRVHEGIKDYCVGYKNGGTKKSSDQAAKRAKTLNVQRNSNSSGQNRRIQQVPQKAMPILEEIVPVMGTPEQQNSGQMVFEYQQNSIMAPLMGYSLGKGINFYQ